MDEDYGEDDQPESCLQNLVYRKNLKWIFVGGKGGVGKTTVSCGLAIQLAEVRETVLLLSTDPAHNISDTFGQQFTKVPTKVEGFNNLFAMELDTDGNDENQTLFETDDGSDAEQLGNNIMETILSAFPGINETITYAKTMKLIESMNFAVIVIDTASTGHTLRLLAFPLIMEKALGKMLELKNRIGPYLNQIITLFGSGIDLENIAEQIEELLDCIKTFNRQLKNHEKTTFVCVCIAEFLSLYETERLFQELNKNEIDCQNIVVNRIFTDIEDLDSNCKMCSCRKELQQTYLAQIRDLYFSFHVTKLPLLDKEVRGVTGLNDFSKYLMQTYFAFRRSD